MTRPWTGGIAAGSREYTPAEEVRVLEAIAAHHGLAKATSLNEFCAKVRIPGRTVRAILSAHDGVEFVVHLAGDGRLFVAEYQDEAERTTRQILSRASLLHARALRRLAFCTNLPRLQGFLFDGEEDRS